MIRPASHPDSVQGVTRSCPSPSGGPFEGGQAGTRTADRPAADRARATAEEARYQTEAGIPPICWPWFIPRPQTRYSAIGTIVTRTRNAGLRKVRVVSKRTYASIATARPRRARASGTRRREPTPPPPRGDPVPRCPTSRAPASSRPRPTFGCGPSGPPCRSRSSRAGRGLATAPLLGTRARSTRSCWKEERSSMAKSIGRQTPLHEHHDAMCEPFRLREVVRGEQDRQSPGLRVHRASARGYRRALDVHADGRLVKEEDFILIRRPAPSRTGRAAPVRPRASSPRASRRLPEPAEASNSSTAGPRRRWSARASSTTSGTVTPDREARDLQHRPDGSSPNGARVGPRDGHVPLRRALQADRPVVDRGLPGPIRPEESDDRFHGGGEIRETRDRVDLAVPNAETFDRDGRIASRVARRGRRGYVAGHRAIMQPPVRRRTIARPSVATTSGRYPARIVQLSSRRVPPTEGEDSAPRRPT